MLFISRSYGLGDFQFSNMLDSWRAACSICVYSYIPSHLGEDCKDDLLMLLSSFLTVVQDTERFTNNTNCRTRKN